MLASLKALVHVVDDDPAVRDALTWALEREGLEVACHESAEAILRERLDDRPGCIVLDVMLPGMSGLDLQYLLLERRVPLPVILLTGHADVTLAVDAMKAGAFDLLQKPVDAVRLITCIRDAVLMDGQRRRALLDRAHVRRCLDHLTPREAEVLNLIVEANTTREIAEVLRISPRTVDVHRAHVLAKMEALSLADLVRMVVAARVVARP